ncbi:GNAT family N-acetyltransferase [Deinococcus yavapaiensis]|uniref:RimJ/RimL family protein N-acetyltransferase n=1 Tax=Deinococcus yavapaiensis KR-236 TaxID=694435 RepID=A0A318S4X2_9DEIO|nr:GNAT family protein [Deinococcus yavapaiensis]PYE52743.1 RimJ/RimL family protein N-acetyltransferase [Deinococcus yavapaiensis KR-236]
MNDWLLAPTLQGRTLRLESLSEVHAARLLRHLDEETTRYLSRGAPADLSVESVAGYLRALNAVPNRVNWAVVTNDGDVAGRISYSEVRPADRWVEIGTMLTTPFRGTTVNPEAKLLLLERAFEVLGANRVHFKVDSRNERSLRAMAKLGAVREGTLRRYQVRPDGFARDSVMFSILAEEWPAVREGLRERVDAALR